MKMKITKKEVKEWIKGNTDETLNLISELGKENKALRKDMESIYDESENWRETLVKILNLVHHCGDVIPPKEDKKPKKKRR